MVAARRLLTSLGLSLLDDGLQLSAVAMPNDAGVSNSVTRLCVARFDGVLRCGDDAEPHSSYFLVERSVLLSTLERLSSVDGLGIDSKLWALAAGLALQ